MTEAAAPPLATEEDVKNRVILPWLAQIGFGPDELQFETRFTVTIGREYEIDIGAARSQEKRSYSDIVCYRHSRPLMVVEVKRDDHLLNEQDRDQAISYARLLREIAPFAVVANSREAHVYDVITRDRLNHPKDSEYEKCGGVISIDDEVRSQAERALIGLNSANFLQLCRQQLAYYLEPLVGSPSSGKVYVEQLFEPRVYLAQIEEEFWSSASRCLAVVGPSGSGKTALICRLVLRSRECRPMFFYDAQMLTQSFSDHLVADFGWLVGRSTSVDQVVSRVAELAGAGGTEFLLVIDGVDRHPDPDRLSVELDQIIRRTKGKALRICVSAEIAGWHRYLSINGRPTATAEETFGTLPQAALSDLFANPGDGPMLSGQLPGVYVPPFTDDELTRAWNRYRIAFGIAGSLVGDVSERARLPFTMRIVAEAYQGAVAIPANWATLSLVELWLRRRMSALPANGTHRRAAGYLAEVMATTGQNSVGRDTATESLAVRGIADPERVLQDLIQRGLLTQSATRRPQSPLSRAQIGFPHERILVYLYAFVDRRWHEFDLERVRGGLRQASAETRLSRAAAAFFVGALFDEWVAAGEVSKHDEAFVQLLCDVGEPLGLIMPFRAVARALADGPEGTRKWLALVDALRASTTSSRWLHAALLAILDSHRAGEVLNELTPDLLRDEGALLLEFFAALQTMEIRPDLAYLPAASQIARHSGEAISLLYSSPRPVPVSWSNFLDWLLPRLRDLPELCRAEAADILLLWQRGSEPRVAHRFEIAQYAHEQVFAAEWWLSDETGEMP